MKVGVIGVGVMGKNHCRVYSKLPGVNLAAVCDSNEENARSIASQYGCESYTNLSHMLSKEKLDAVSIVVPTALHEKFACEVMSAGIPILLEKPIAFDEAESKRIIAAAKKTGVLVTVGHIERFNPVVTTAKQMLDKGAVGKLLSLVFRRIGSLPGRVKDVNVIQDIGVHDIDLIRYFIGKPHQSFCANAGCAVVSGRYDYAQVLFNYGSGLSAFMECNWITPTKLRQFSVVGKEGLLLGDLANQTLDYYPTIIEKVDGEMRLGQVERQAIAIKKGEPLKLELEHFVSCVKTGEKPLVSLEESLAAITTANEVTNSLMKRFMVKKALRKIGVPDSFTNRLINQR